MLRTLVRDVEHKLYHAATLWAVTTDSLVDLAELVAGTGDEDEQRSALQHIAAASMASCREYLLNAAGRALAAAAVAPDLGVAEGTGTWANVVNRYYH